MKTIKIRLLTILIAMIISSAWTEESDAIKKDMARLQGEWSMVSGLADGQAMPPEMAKQMKRVCKGDVTTTKMGEEVFMKAKFAIDPSKTPKTIDYQMIDGLTKGKKQL